MSMPISFWRRTTSPTPRARAPGTRARRSRPWRAPRWRRSDRRAAAGCRHGSSGYGYRCSSSPRPFRWRLKRRLRGRGFHLSPSLTMARRAGAIPRNAKGGGTMQRADRHIVVSHVGSLVRPPALVTYLAEDPATSSPTTAARSRPASPSRWSRRCGCQAEAGIDVVSDGEYGKSVNWAFYVHRRLERPRMAAVHGRQSEGPDDRRHQRPRPRGVPRVLRRIRRPRPAQRAHGRAARSSPARSPIRARPNCSMTSPTSRPGCATAKGVVGFLPVVAPASALPNAKNEHYRDEESFLFALAEALRTEYRAIIDAGPRSPGRRRVPAVQCTRRWCRR